MSVLRFLSGLKLSPHRFAWLYLAVVLLLANILLVSCTGLFGGSSRPAATATPSALETAKLHWCMKPSMLFRDEEAVTPTATATATTTPGATATPTATITPGATTTPGITVTATATATTIAGSTPTPTVVPGTPRTITDWSEVEASLGFTVYLPSKLPKGTCLVNAQATIHDPIIGGSFTIAYLLPDHSALSLSEAPVVSQNTIFQCNLSNGATSQANATPKAGTPTSNPSATQGAPLLLCSGARDTTNIVMSARGSTAYLQQLFNNLQPNLTWIPIS
jgi:hypothetical protein